MECKYWDLGSNLSIYIDIPPYSLEHNIYTQRAPVVTLAMRGVDDYFLAPILLACSIGRTKWLTCNAS